MSIFNQTGGGGYKKFGKTWYNVSTLPYNFYQGSAVVIDNKIHVLGGNDGNTYRYTWDGSSWSNVSTLPYEFTDGSAVVFGGLLHILGGSRVEEDQLKHYSYTDTYIKA